jgi:hypothetical protein
MNNRDYTLDGIVENIECPTAVFEFDESEIKRTFIVVGKRNVQAVFPWFF